MVKGGPTRGKAISSTPHVLSPLLCSPKETFGTKKELFGSARIAVGGRTPGAGVSVSGERAKPERRDPTALEAVIGERKDNPNILLVNLLGLLENMF